MNHLEPATVVHVQIVGRNNERLKAALFERETSGFAPSCSALAGPGGSRYGAVISFTGTVKDGVVMLPPGVKLPEGLEVQLTVPEPAVPPSFAERYAAYIGVADDLPSDLAENLDRYVHGHRKP